MLRRLALASLSLACTREATREPIATPPSVAVEASASAEVRLAALAIHDHDFARRELYSWTTAAQLDGLRGHACLLRAEADVGLVSPFHQSLRELAASAHEQAPLARMLLEHEGLTRRRYAWTNPFATVLGLGPRRYGDVLIRIELDAQAYVARFEPSASPPLAFVDMQGRPITAAQVQAEPLRVAAILHVAHPRDAPAYREYVVTSEAMLASWSIMTPELDERVEQDAALLEQLAAGSFGALPRAAIESPAAPDWTQAGSTPLADWHASLAFDSPRYRPSAAALRRIAAALRETRRGEPLRVDARAVDARAVTARSVDAWALDARHVDPGSDACPP